MKKSDKKSLILWGTFALLMLVVIYGQSLLPPQESGEVSGFIVTYLKPLLDPFGLYEADVFHYFVRKTGHFIEYALFSVFFGNFCKILAALRKKTFGFAALFVCLAVAVSDELLQSFTGRGSSVRDVVLDFSGALFGLGAVWLLACHHAIKEKKYET